MNRTSDDPPKDGDDYLTREEIVAEARGILRMTIATEKGRTWSDRRGVERCLSFLAVLADDHDWDFLVEHPEASL